MRVPNEITMYFHCRKCLQEKPPSVSPAEWARTQAGWTQRGLQVWCTRHDINIIHLDFSGTKVSVARVPRRPQDKSKIN